MNNKREIAQVHVFSCLYLCWQSIVAICFFIFPFTRKANASLSKLNFWILSQELSVITLHGLLESRHLEEKNRNGKTAMRLHVNMFSGLSTDDLCTVAFLQAILVKMVLKVPGSKIHVHERAASDEICPL